MDAPPAIRSLTVSGILIEEYLYPPGTRLGLHVHDYAFVSWALCGGYESATGSRAVDYEPGAAWFHPKEHEHDVLIGNERVHGLSVEIPEEFVQRLKEVGSSTPANPWSDRAVLPWLCRRLHEELTACSRGSTLVIEGLVLELLGAVGSANCPSRDHAEPRWLARVDECIREEFDRAFTVAALARRLGLHPVHLSRTWRRFRGVSVGESIHRARVMEACRRIQSGAPLADVALDVGFSDQTHFSRVFKRVTGTTPGAFRRQSCSTARSSSSRETRGAATTAPLDSTTRKSPDLTRRISTIDDTATATER